MLRYRHKTSGISRDQLLATTALYGSFGNEKNTKFICEKNFSSKEKEIDFVDEIKNEAVYCNSMGEFAEALGVTPLIKQISLRQPWKILTPWLGFEQSLSYLLKVRASLTNKPQFTHSK